jgi:hypothetical protein
VCHVYREKIYFELKVEIHLVGLCLLQSRKSSEIRLQDIHLSLTIALNKGEEKKKEKKPTFSLTVYSTRVN